MDLNKMKVIQYMLSILIFTTGCHVPTINPASPPFKAVDTTKVISHPDPHPANDAAGALKTHLRDTKYATGSFILFLRPDDLRYAELEKMAEDEAGDGDADFGVGISTIQDSLKRNDRYKDIKVLATTKKYMCITDYKDGPLIIDRDSVSYGFILSAKGRPIDKYYNSVHSGNYLGEIDEYFWLH
jgi:hypothetical protein